MPGWRRAQANPSAGREATPWVPIFSHGAKCQISPYSGGDGTCGAGNSPSAQISGFASDSLPSSRNAPRDELLVSEVVIVLAHSGQAPTKHRQISSPLPRQERTSPRKSTRTRVPRESGPAAETLDDIAEKKAPLLGRSPPRPNRQVRKHSSSFSFLVLKQERQLPFSRPFACFAGNSPWPPIARLRKE